MTLQHPDIQQRRMNVDCRWWSGGDGNRIFAMLNVPGDEVKGSALFIPPFGMNIPSLFLPAYCLANAGFRTARFDARNNVGASDGTILDFRIGTLIDDARLAAAKLAEMSGSDDFLIVSSSIAAPVALAVARDYPNARAVLLAPAIDLFRTVDLAAQAPGCTAALKRGDPDVSKVHAIFGHMANVQTFVDDLGETGLDSVEGVLETARAVRGRADVILAEKDEYLTPEVRDALIDALDAEQNMLMLENAGHNFAGQPAAMKRAFSRLIEIAEEHFGVPKAERSTGLPSDQSLLAAGKLERMGIAASYQMQQSRGAA